MNLLPPPGPERRRQLTLLGFLVIVLAAYFGYRYWPTAGGPAASSNETAQGGAAQNRGKLVVPDLIDLTQLEAAPADSATSRNPFRFGQPPAPPRVELPPVEPPIDRTPVRPLPPPAPQVPLKLLELGSVSATKQALVILLDPESGATFLVKEGSTIDGKYKVVKVNANNVIVAFLDGSGQKSLYLEK